MDTNFIIDGKGRKVAVMLPMHEYEKLLDAMEELEDVKAYDLVKKKKSDLVPLEKAIDEIQKSWKKRKR